MLESFEFYERIDIGIASAAVADYAPKEVAKEKIKKNDENLPLNWLKIRIFLKQWGEKNPSVFGRFCFGNSE
jgi:phosphopantothenoylcysteine decarboxylase/phosphopantothenate--cysteine ligase